MFWLPKKYNVENNTLIRDWDGDGILDVVAVLEDGGLNIKREDDFELFPYLHNTEFVFHPTISISVTRESSSTFSHLLRSRWFSHQEQNAFKQGAVIGASFGKHIELRGITLNDADRFAGMLRHRINTPIKLISVHDGSSHIISKRVFS